MLEHSKKKAIGTLFVMWPRNANEPPQDVMFKAYEKACLYCEPVAVERAINRFIHGSVDNHSMAFRPTAPQIAQLAGQIQRDTDRIGEIKSRVLEQTNRLEYQAPPQEVRDAQVNRWKQVRNGFKF